MLGRALTILLGLCLVCPLSVSRADSGPIDVALTVDDCLDTDAELVKRLLMIELGTSMPQAVRTSPDGDAAARSTTRIEIGCDGALVELRVHDPVTGKSLIRRISPGGRKGRERLLALAAMELVVASWIELEATPRPAVPAADTVVDREVRESAKQVARKRLAPPAWTSTAMLLGGGSYVGLVHAGVGLRIIRDSTRGIGWAADVSAHTANDEVSLGTVRITSLIGSGTFHLQAPWRGVRVRAGAGVRVSAVSMSGEPTMPVAVTGSQVTGLTAGPLIRIGAQTRSLGRLALSLSAESGYHVLSMRGLVDGQAGSELSGVWVSGQLGVGWTW